MRIQAILRNFINFFLRTSFFNRIYNILRDSGIRTRDSATVARCATNELNTSLFSGLQWGSETRMSVFDSVFYFLSHESKDIQTAALQALGFMCIRHYDLMMVDSLKLK